MERGQIVKLGHYLNPSNECKPFYVQIHWFDNMPPIEQPLTDDDFWDLLNNIVKGNAIILDVKVVP